MQISACHYRTGRWSNYHSNSHGQTPKCVLYLLWQVYRPEKKFLFSLLKNSSIENSHYMQRVQAPSRWVTRCLFGGKWWRFRLPAPNCWLLRRVRLGYLVSQLVSYLMCVKICTRFSRQGWEFIDSIMQAAKLYPRGARVLPRMFHLYRLWAHPDKWVTLEHRVQALLSAMFWCYWQNGE